MARCVVQVVDDDEPAARDRDACSSGWWMMSPLTDTATDAMSMGTLRDSCSSDLCQYTCDCITSLRTIATAHVMNQLGPDIPIDAASSLSASIQHLTIMQQLLLHHITPAFF